MSDLKWAGYALGAAAAACGAIGAALATPAAAHVIYGDGLVAVGSEAETAALSGAFVASGELGPNVRYDPGGVARERGSAT